MPRWGITADDAADGSTVLLCLQEIDRCRPYFISFLGGRYGWSLASGPDPLLERSLDKAASQYPIVDRYRDRSVTELEIRYASKNSG